MIHDLDQTLKKLLQQKGALNSDEVDIRFEMPNREWATKVARPTVNLYLFDLRENRELRLNEWSWQPQPPDRKTRSRPPVRVDVTYLITAWATEVEDEHRLLSRVLATVLQHPELPPETFEGGLRAQRFPIRLQAAQPDGVLKSPADFWGAMDNQLKGGITLTATLTLDMEAYVTAPLVFTKRVRFRQAQGKQRARLRVGAGLAPREFGYEIKSDYLAEWSQIAGRVLRGEDPGEPVPGATVIMLEKELATETDEGGRFTFPRMAPGTYTLSAQLEGEEPTHRQVLVPGPSYDLRLNGRKEGKASEEKKRKKSG